MSRFPDLGLPRPYTESRYLVFCSDCGETWSPSIGAGFSHYAGSEYCPRCGTDYRVWVAFNRLIGGIFGDQDER